MKKILFLFLIAFLPVLHLYSQAWIWAEQAKCSSGSPQNGQATAVDKSGNVLITGQFADGISYSSYGIYSNGSYAFKFNPGSTCLWGKGSWTGGWGYGITADKWNNVYTTGDFTGSDFFNPYILTSKGTDMFLVKYDSNGNIKWASQSIVHGVGYYVIAYGVTTDNKGNVYVTGVFNDTAAFGKDTLKTKTINSFIAKYDSAGNEIWVKDITTTSPNGVYAQSVTTYKGYLYLTGYFEGTIRLGNILLSGGFGTESFLIKCDTAGNALWGKQIVNTGTSNSVSYSVTTDKAGIPYIGGGFKGSVKFGSYTESSTYMTPYLAKYDTLGNIKWIRTGTILYPVDWLGIYSIAADTMNHIYATALNENFSLISSIGFGTDTFTINSPHDPFVLLKFDTAGHLDAGDIVQSGVGVTIACSANGQDVYISGSLVGNDTMGNTVLSFSCATNSSFVARWHGDSIINSFSGINKLIPNNASLSLFPNPCKGLFTLQISNEQTEDANLVEIYNVMGQKVYSQSLPENHSCSIDFSTEPSGIYFYRVQTKNGNLVGDGKLVIER